MKRLLLVLAMVGLTLAMVPSAFGDVFNFYLTIDEHGAAPPVPPADSVLVSVDLLTSSTATVTFTGETIGANTYYLDDVFFNVNGPFTVGTITGTSSPTQTYAASQHQGLDSYGTMSEEITPNGGHPSSSITISLTSGGTWANAFSVLTPTCASNGSQAATCTGGSDVPSPNSGGGYNAGFYGARGFGADATVGTSSTTASLDREDIAGFVVPEPASLLLFGSVVLLLATFARRKSAAKV